MNTATPHILYLHGLGSNGQGSTVQGLRQAGMSVTAPDYRPEHFATSQQQLQRLLAQHDFDAIVGTSMGGYYALMLSAANRHLPVIAVNPCFEPQQFLRKYLDTPAQDYVNNQPIHFTPYMLEAFAPLTLSIDPAPIIIIGEQDDVIPPDAQKQFCRQANWRWQSTDWGHRVADPSQLADAIRHAIAQFSKPSPKSSPAPSSGSASFLQPKPSADSTFNRSYPTPGGHFSVFGYDQLTQCNYHIADCDSLSQAIAMVEQHTRSANAYPASLSDRYQVFDEKGQCCYQTNYRG